MKTKPYFANFAIFVLLVLIVLVSPAGAGSKIMPLGDSITQGSASGVNEVNLQISYRKALWDLLVNAGYDVDFVGSLNSGSSVPDFDPNHEGHPGWTDDAIVYGHPGEPLAGQLADWLAVFQPDIVLLHIGTNDLGASGLNTSPAGVEAILNTIDNYSREVWVILARIINRACCVENPKCSECEETMYFNDNVEAMALERINNPTFPDRIKIVNMETGANINYNIQPLGDMWDNLHPFQYGQGYYKMADIWFTALKDILPPIPLSPPMNFRISQ